MIVQNQTTKQVTENHKTSHTQSSIRIKKASDKLKLHNNIRINQHSNSLRHTPETINDRQISVHRDHVPGRVVGVQGDGVPGGAQ